MRRMASAFKTSCVSIQLLVRRGKAALKKGAQVTSSFTMVGAVTIFFCSPVVALCCDRFGRRPLMILAQLGNTAAVLAILAVELLNISLYVPRTYLRHLFRMIYILF